MNRAAEHKFGAVFTAFVFWRATLIFGRCMAAKQLIILLLHVKVSLVQVTYLVIFFFFLNSVLCGATLKSHYWGSHFSV